MMFTRLIGYIQKQAQDDPLLSKIDALLENIIDTHRRGGSIQQELTGALGHSIKFGDPESKFTQRLVDKWIRATNEIQYNTSKITRENLEYLIKNDLLGKYMYELLRDKQPPLFRIVESNIITNRRAERPSVLFYDESSMVPNRSLMWKILLLFGIPLPQQEVLGDPTRFIGINNKDQVRAFLSTRQPKAPYDVWVARHAANAYDVVPELSSANPNYYTELGSPQELKNNPNINRILDAGCVRGGYTLKDLLEISRALNKNVTVSLGVNYTPRHTGPLLAAYSNPGFLEVSAVNAPEDLYREAERQAVKLDEKIQHQWKNIADKPVDLKKYFSGGISTTLASILALLLLPKLME